jgi:hypothetical protein
MPHRAGLPTRSVLRAGSGEATRHVLLVSTRLQQRSSEPCAQEMPSRHLHPGLIAAETILNETARYPSSPAITVPAGSARA